MKVKVFAVLSFLICFLAAIPPIVSASDTEVYVITLDSAGNSYYMESFGNGTFTPQEYIGGKRKWWLQLRERNRRFR